MRKNLKKPWGFPGAFLVISCMMSPSQTRVEGTTEKGCSECDSVRHAAMIWGDSLCHAWSRSSPRFGSGLSRLLERSEYLWMLHDLLSEVAIRTDGKHAIAPLRQLASHHLIPGCLLWVIMHRPVAKNTDVRGVEKIHIPPYYVVEFRHPS